MQIWKCDTVCKIKSYNPNIMYEMFSCVQWAGINFITSIGAIFFLKVNSCYAKKKKKMLGKF